MRMRTGLRRGSVSIGVWMMAAASLVTGRAMGQVTGGARAGQQSMVVEQVGGGYLGIGGLDIGPERAKALNLKEVRGVEVSSLAADGPALKAGVKEGDVMLEFNGQPVQGTAHFQRMVRETPAGRQVKLVVWRNGAAVTLTATVGENRRMMIGGDDSWTFTMPPIPPMPTMPAMPEMPRMQLSMQNPMLGIMGEALGPEEQLAEFFGVHEGVLVRSVRRGSAAEKAGLRAGDVITKIDDTHISTSADITHALRGLKGKKSFNVILVRNKKEMSLAMAMETAMLRVDGESVDC
jgi:serine protease Do